VQVEGQSDLYLINGGQRQLISSFVKNQRFANVVPRIIKQSTLQTIPLGTMAMPTDGTLVKAESNPAVYYIKDGLRLPVTGRVFSLHSFKFSDVVNLPDSEVNSWVLGSLLTPPESSLLRSKNNTTLYWVSNGSIHAINYNFYLQRGLGSFPVIYMTDSEIKEFPVGEPYIL
jgi:hypothetical protein